MTNHKLGVIVPYRDRYQHLYDFKNSIIKYLESKSIDFELIVVEQDDKKTFNRGKLLNIGFIYAKKLDCDYVVFHDVDMIPNDVDYSYSDFPVHLANNFNSIKEFKRIVFDEYFGGVTLFPVDMFEQINGYSNEYWGWGFEDNDLLFRCKVNGIPLDNKETNTNISNSVALKFNGDNAYAIGKNTINFNGDFTIFVSFKPDELKLNHEQYDDKFSIFTIPGLDLSINYNSYCRYNFEIYDANDELIYINSNIKPTYYTNICVTISQRNKIIKMYQDGKLVGEKKFENRLHNYKNESNFYLGAGNPNREENKNFFNGLIDSFSIFNNALDEKEVIEISKNRVFGLTENFGEFKSANRIKVCYDAKFIRGYKLIDLSGNGNDAEIYNCEIVENSFNYKTTISIPFRRNCTFDLLAHGENGYVGSSWKDITTRYNQLRFYNEVSKGYKKTHEDGLCNCKYKELSHANIDNQTHIMVSI